MTYGTPCHTIGHFVFWYHHVTYRTPCYTSGHLVIYRECYGFERAFFTLRPFLPCTPSCCFQGFPGASSLISRLAGLQADLRNIAPAALFFWITAIHNKSILVGSTWGLWLASYKKPASNGIWILFTISDQARNFMFYPFGHRALQSVRD